jgi:hypothetical protein
MSLLRLDVTEDKIFTISDASKNILSAVDTPVQVKLYVTPKSDMPTGMTSFEQDITDKLDELRVASDGMLQYTVLHLTAANAISGGVNLATGAPPEEEEESEEEALEKRMLDKGIRPHSVRSLSQDQMTNQYIYSSIGIGYRDKKEEIIPDLLPQDLMNLEYRLVSTIFKLTQKEPPVVVVVAPQERVNIAPQVRQMMMQMGQQVPETEDPYSYLQKILESEKYSVQRVEISQASPLPEEFDTLVVVDPRQLNERQRWEIGRAESRIRLRGHPPGPEPQSARRDSEHQSVVGKLRDHREPRASHGCEPHSPERFHGRRPGLGGPAQHGTAY